MERSGVHTIQVTRCIHFTLRWGGSSRVRQWRRSLRQRSQLSIMVQFLSCNLLSNGCLKEANIWNIFQVDLGLLSEFTLLPSGRQPSRAHIWVHKIVLASSCVFRICIKIETCLIYRNVKTSNYMVWTWVGLWIPQTTREDPLRLSSTFHDLSKT